MTTPITTPEEMLDAACAAVEAEEELDGPIPAEVKRETLADPERSLRAAVVTTKRGIGKRIRALRSHIAPPDQRHDGLRERIKRYRYHFAGQPTADDVVRAVREVLRGNNISDLLSPREAFEIAERAIRACWPAIKEKS